ncbi:MAG: MFS transporter [Candidatus Thorarchaeota archaeon]|nr:MAG: MFS transporter [Candidatus Thorarchaeota archaeon]
MEDKHGPEFVNNANEIARKKPGRLGLSSNLWRLAAVLAIAQFSTALWKWEFSVFLEGFLEPWQMGLIFSTATFTGLVASIFSGYIADFIGRRLTIALGFIPVSIGLFSLAYFPIWPFIPVQYGLVWFGMSTSRLMARAIPADEIASDSGANPARRLMMVMMPLWFVDGFGPLVGSVLFSRGYESGDLHLIGAFSAIISFVAAMLLINESLGSEVIKKARAGPKIAFRNLGRSYWLVAIGMIGFTFSWMMSIPLIGNLCVGPWGVDRITYGFTWSLFSFTAAVVMYHAATLADRNLKAALMVGIIGNAIVFLWFSIGSGAIMMYIINFVWAIPFVLYIGAERSIIVLVVSEETKGRALGTYDLLMGFIGIGAQLFGAMIWEITDSLRVVYAVAGVIALATSVILFVILMYIKIPKHRVEPELLL